VRLTWILEDKSMVHVDIPGPENESKYELSRLPHVALEAPGGRGYTGLHLSENGVGVPAQSTPAHIELVRDGQLNYRLGPLRNEVKAKSSNQAEK
jgi:hypothetical protein